MAKVRCGKKKPPKQNKRRRWQGTKQRTHFVEESTDQDDVCAMYYLSRDRKKLFKVDLKLFGRKKRMEIDTGASKMILNEATYGRLCDTLDPLKKSKAVLTTYNNTHKGLFQCNRLLLEFFRGQSKTSYKAFPM